MNTQNNKNDRVGIKVLNTFIDALNEHEAVAKIVNWCKNDKSRYVCLCNVHSVTTAKDTPSFYEVLDRSDMVLPDGTPVAWMMRRKGFKEQKRVAGPDLMTELCRVAEKEKLSIALFGSNDATLEIITAKLNSTYPDLKIVKSISPPYGKWSKQLEDEYIDAINNSGAGMVFVALGCPRQEQWMLDNRERIQAVMLGVGAAFDFFSGNVRRAPIWMQKLGIEWLHRLMQEPGRLWKRYLVTNTKFILYAIPDLLSCIKRYSA